MARFLFLKQKGFLMLLVLSLLLIISGCGHKAPPVPPELAFSTVMELPEATPGDNVNYLKTKPLTTERN